MFPVHSTLTHFPTVRCCLKPSKLTKEADTASKYSGTIRKPSALLLPFPFLMHRCMCVCMFMCTYVYMVCRGQRVLHTSFCRMPPISFEMSLSLTWTSPVRLDWLDGEPRHPPVSAPFTNAHHHTQHFYIGSEDRTWVPVLAGQARY